MCSIPLDEWQPCGIGYVAKGFYVNYYSTGSYAYYAGSSVVHIKCSHKVTALGKRLREHFEQESKSTEIEKLRAILEELDRK